MSTLAGKSIPVLNDFVGVFPIVIDDSVLKRGI